MQCLWIMQIKMKAKRRKKNNYFRWNMLLFQFHAFASSEIEFSSLTRTSMLVKSHQNGWMSSAIHCHIIVFSNDTDHSSMIMNVLQCVHRSRRKSWHEKSLSNRDISILILIDHSLSLPVPHPSTHPLGNIHLAKHSNQFTPLPIHRNHLLKTAKLRCGKGSS